MSTDNFDQIFENTARNLKVNPPRALLDRLEDKLDKHETRKSIINIKRMAWAASVVAIVSLGLASMLYFRTHTHATQTAHLENYSEGLEDLSTAQIADAGYFEVAKVKELNAYLFRN